MVDLDTLTSILGNLQGYLEELEILATLPDEAFL